MRLFDVNGPLVSAMSKLADIVICNVMFCLFSLPIVTIGASLAALFTCMQQLIYEEERDEGLVFRAFWNAFLRNFRQATALWLICLGAMAFLGAYYWIVQFMAGALGRVYRITFYLLALLFLMGFIYIFPLQARFRNRVRHTLRNAWLLSVAALPWTALALAVPAALIYVCFIMNPAALTLMEYLWAVCGFGLIAYLDSFFFAQAFKKISRVAPADPGGPAEDALFTDEAHRTEDLMVQESTFSDPDWNRRDPTGK